MPANTAPIFGAVPDVSGVAMTAVNTRSDGDGTIGTNIWKAFTAGANGSWISRIRVVNTATVAATATAATTVRLFVSSQTTGATTSANTFCIGELAMPGITAAATTSATVGQELPCNFAIPASWTILATYHQALNANTGLSVIVFGSDY